MVLRHWFLLTCLSMTALQSSAIALGSDGTTRDNVMDDAAVISKIIQEYAAAYNEGDLQRFMEIFSDDFVSMEYGRPTRKGKEALDDWRSFAQLAFAKYDRHLEISTDEIKVSGDMAFERGLVKVVLKPKSGGEAVTEEHRFLDVWQRRNGQWKIVQAMTNK